MKNKVHSKGHDVTIFRIFLHDKSAIHVFGSFLFKKLFRRSTPALPGKGSGDVSHHRTLRRHTTCRPLATGRTGLLQKFQPNSTCGATRQLLQLTTQRFYSKTSQMHQEFKTVHTAVKQILLSAVCLTFACCSMYSLELPMTDRKTVRNM